MSRKITIEDTVTMKFERMEEIRHELNLDHNEIFCGYGRQPIYYTDKKIYCHCALNKKQCSRIPYEGWKNDTCKTYQLYFKTSNNV